MSLVRFLVALQLASCAPAARPKAEAPAARPEIAVVTDRAKQHGLNLPQAANTVGLSEDAVPHAVLARDEVLLDDTAVANVRELRAETRLRRVDGLFEALRKYREAWKAAHPGQDFHGVIVFWLDATTPAWVVKSLFQTAAFAGFPNGSFAVRQSDAPQRLARINADARVPGPPRPASPPRRGDPFQLHLEIDQGKAQLIWKYGPQVVNVLDVPAGGLQQLVHQQWQAHGGHREGSDWQFDQAVLHIDHRASFASVIEAIDALNGPKREFTHEDETITVPAFNVTFAVN